MRGGVNRGRYSLVLRDFFDAKQIDQLKTRAAELLEAFNPQDHPLTRFVSDTDDV